MTLASIGLGMMIFSVLTMNWPLLLAASILVLVSAHSVD